MAGDPRLGHVEPPVQVGVLRKQVLQLRVGDRVSQCGHAEHPATGIVEIALAGYVLVKLMALLRDDRDGTEAPPGDVFSSTPSFVPILNVTLGDQFYPSPTGKNYDVKKPKALCTPVDKNDEGIQRRVGHEIAGVVESIGPDAGVTPGAKVAVYPWIGCGKCATCLAGDENMCLTPRSLGAPASGSSRDLVLDMACLARGSSPQ